MVAATLLVSLPAATTAASAAEATETAHGTWYQGTEQIGATTCVETTDVTGRWSVTLLKDGTANLSSEVMYHGKLHAAWGGQALGPRALWRETETGYEVTQGSGAVQWSFTLNGDHVTFTIPDRYPGCTPSTGTLHGTVS